MEYYYAYHGPKNDRDFDWNLGYGLKSKSKRDKVPIGSKVIIIQKTKNASHFCLCGIFSVTKHYDDSSNALPYRFKLKNESNLKKYIVLDDVKLSNELPFSTKRYKHWSNFQNHFCAQGITFQNKLDYEISQKLLSYLSTNFKPIENMLNEFRLRVEDSAKLSADDRRERLKSANTKPMQKTVTTIVYDRNPDVVAEVLFLAAGKCGTCLKPAPFNRKSDGTPYLEVHHKVPLSLGGEDTVENSIALCPNCHRKAHYG